jgi:diadenosine tetraphosphate (Ap4A) HIT family hydrolase
MKKFSNLNESIKFGKHLIDKERLLYNDDDFFIMFDGFPVSPGHILIITTGNEVTYFDFSDSKKNKLSKLIDIATDLILKEHNPDGYNIGMNCGEAAGQTVMQFHCHLIPRYSGDVDNPRGGVRHSVIGKGYY